MPMVMCPKFFGASCIRISIKNCYRKGQGVEELISIVSSNKLLFDEYQNSHGKILPCGAAAYSLQSQTVRVQLSLINEYLIYYI